MSLAKTRRVLGTKSNAFSDRELAEIVAKALREDFGEMASAVKQIGRITTASLNTITNWYQAKNVPSSRHLLVLARSSPGILRIVLMQVGGEDLWDAFQLYPARKPQSGLRPYSVLRPAKPAPANVTINVTINGLNDRQSWFLAELKRVPDCDAASISVEWNVTIRTARRDIAHLQNLGWIIYSGAKRNGRYTVCEQALPD